jgi:organic hydroperoxide reductase OsmC/OhrA
LIQVVAASSITQFGPRPALVDKLTTPTLVFRPQVKVQMISPLLLDDEVTLEQNDHGFAITAVHLKLKGKVPGVDAGTFERLAQGAKANCPVSKVLNADTTIEVEPIT